MTQEELAKRACVSRGIIARLENGKDETTTTKTMLAIANALGKDVKDIFFA
jgi:transcriptional regulator with XRE-family HTH domain